MCQMSVTRENQVSILFIRVLSGCLKVIGVLNCIKHMQIDISWQHIYIKGSGNKNLPQENTLCPRLYSHSF